MVNGRSVSKSVCSRWNKGNWCENPSDNVFAIGHLNLKKKKKKHEQMEGLVVFCQEV